MSPFDLLSVLNWTLFFYCLKLHDICTCPSSKIEWAYSIIKKNGGKSNGSLRLEINENRFSEVRAYTLCMKYRREKSLEELDRHINDLECSWGAELCG